MVSGCSASGGEREGEDICSGTQTCLFDLGSLSLGWKRRLDDDDGTHSLLMHACTSRCS